MVFLMYLVEYDCYHIKFDYCWNETHVWVGINKKHRLKYSKKL